MAPMYAGIDGLVRAVVEEIPTDDNPRKESLSVVLRNRRRIDRNCGAYIHGGAATGS